MLGWAVGVNLFDAYIILFFLPHFNRLQMHLKVNVFQYNMTVNEKHTLFVCLPSSYGETIQLSRSVCQRFETELASVSFLCKTVFSPFLSSACTESNLVPFPEPMLFVRVLFLLFSIFRRK